MIFTRIFNIWLNTKVSALIGSDISNLCFKNYLYLDYEKQIKGNSSEKISTLVNEIHVTIAMINSLLNGITALIIIFSVTIGLILITPFITLFSIFTLSSSYFIFAYFSRIRLKFNSSLWKNSEKNQVQLLQETLRCRMEKF